MEREPVKAQAVAMASEPVRVNRNVMDQANVLDSAIAVDSAVVGDFLECSSRVGETDYTAH